jgi:hypothetical protein
VAISYVGRSLILLIWNNKDLTANVDDNSAINNDAISVHSSTGTPSITDPNWGAFVFLAFIVVM